METGSSFSLRNRAAEASTYEDKSERAAITVAADGLPWRPATLPGLILRSSVATLALMAVACSVVLLLMDAAPWAVALLPDGARALPHAASFIARAPITAAPLLMAGASYVALQLILRPRPLELLKRLMLASAFILWGIDQLMPPGPLSTAIGDLVISLFVFDLALIIVAQLRETM